jgi:hypothetical protein
MDEQRRVVTRIPLDELDVEGRTWRRTTDADGPVVRSHLRSDRSLLAVAVIGEPLHLYSGSSAFEIWKRELGPRLAVAEAFRLEDFPDERAYVASVWDDGSGESLVLFEQHH